jgi:hypothetical protein
MAYRLRFRGAPWCAKLGRTIPIIVAIACVLVAGAAAQQAPLTLSSNDIMGFESLATWNVTGSSSPPGFVMASTANRTQGSAAFSIANPPNLTKLLSQPISSTATALAGIGNSGALLQIDVFLPVQKGNATNSGSIQPYVTSRSRGLSKVALGQVFFNNYRAGIYNTIGFAIPDAVSSALGGATFSDLTFEFDVSSPGKITGAYLFDNLRVHSVPLIQSPTGQPPPPGYGGSVNLVVTENAPVTPVTPVTPVIQNFNLGPTQIPNGFHLKLGTVGGSSVHLQLGLDGNPAVACTYGLDNTDAAGRSYMVDSCDGGFQAGDLVNANWVSVVILGGDSTERKIRAQLALSPMGDLTGAGLIPPMPTFWGDADTCVPAPVHGTVVTTSTSCSNQTAQANEIITNYFNQVNSAPPAPNWIVPPTPEFALRHGDGTPHNNLNGPPPNPNDPPFDNGGDLNPGGSFDAYWNLDGDLTPMVVQGTDENVTTFGATFSAHSVLFGLDSDVVEVIVTAETDSAETTPTVKAGTSTGTFELYLFEELSYISPFTPSAGFDIDHTFIKNFDVPDIQIWIFTLKLGATTEVEIEASGPATASGLNLVVTPSVSLGAHISGGIGISGLVFGGVDTIVNLVTLATPITAQTTLVSDTSPSICAYELGGSLKSDLTLGSGGGRVDLVATFGDCPFCYTETETLFKWDPIAPSLSNLFNYTSVGPPFLGLPASSCPFTSTASIPSPASGASLSSGLPISLTGSVKPDNSTIPVNNTSYNWTYTPGLNASTVKVNSGGTTANPNVTFGAPTSGSTSSWTIGLSGTVTVDSAGGTVITSNAPATSVAVTVSSLSAGVYISQVSDVDNGIAVPDSNGVLQVGNVPGTITISGLVVGAPSGTLNTTFTVALCTDGGPNGYSATCSTTDPATTLTTIGTTTTTPSTTWTGFGGNTYKFTMTTTVGGSPFGTTASVLIWGTVLE